MSSGEIGGVERVAPALSGLRESRDKKQVEFINRKEGSSTPALIEINLLAAAAVCI